MRKIIVVTVVIQLEGKKQKAERPGQSKALVTEMARWGWIQRHLEGESGGAPLLLCLMLCGEFSPKPCTQQMLV